MQSPEFEFLIWKPNFLIFKLESRKSITFTTYLTWILNIIFGRNSYFWGTVSASRCVCGLSGSVFMDGADGILSFHHENRPWEIRSTGGRGRVMLKHAVGLPKSSKENLPWNRNAKLNCHRLCFTNVAYVLNKYSTVIVKCRCCGCCLSSLSHVWARNTRIDQVRYNCDHMVMSIYQQGLPCQFLNHPLFSFNTAAAD